MALPLQFFLRTNQRSLYLYSVWAKILTTCLSYTSSCLIWNPTCFHSKQTNKQKTNKNQTNKLFGIWELTQPTYIVNGVGHVINTLKLHGLSISALKRLEIHNNLWVILIFHKSLLLKALSSLIVNFENSLKSTVREETFDSTNWNSSYAVWRAFLVHGLLLWWDTIISQRPFTVYHFNWKSAPIHSFALALKIF